MRAESSSSVVAKSSHNLDKNATPSKRPLSEEKYNSYYKKYVSKREFNALKQKAIQAVKEERIYAVIGTHGVIMDAPMRARGWIQKFYFSEEHKFVGSLKEPSTKEDHILSKLISKTPTNFLWCFGRLSWNHVGAATVVNQFPRMSQPFYTKVGLSSVLQGQHWYYKKGIADVRHPRTFEIENEDDLTYFSSHYRMCACVSLIKFFVEEMKQNADGIKEEGKITLDVVDFAIQRICEYINYQENADLDVWNISIVFEEDWTLFLLMYYDVVHYNAGFKTTKGFTLKKLIQSCKKCLDALAPYWPDLDIEGFCNIWIVKPGSSCRGHGIKLFKSLSDISTFCKSRNHYVIQKYIERPLLIYKTKFDIRQWFLVTSLIPLEIWMYHDCYLRFSSKEFSLIDLHESIHLCNNSIQCKYSNGQRSSYLPDENMWDLERFLGYLRSSNQDTKWKSHIFPKMQEAITGALLASQENMVHRQNSFMLYGADFLLTEDFTVMLIEINSQPAMGSTTSVTARMCRQVIEDTCKVVLDRRKNEKADTGKFYLSFKQKMLPLTDIHHDEFPIICKKLRIHKRRIKRRKVKTEETEENGSNTQTHSLDWRTLKYEEVANYKEHRKVKIVPINRKDETESLPLQPGDITPHSDYTVVCTATFAQLGGMTIHRSQLSPQKSLSAGLAAQ